MESLEKAYYDVRFENAFLKAKGNAFQTFFNELMGRAYKGDYMPCRPWGNRGDRKNDGFLKSERRLFQVYAPNKMTGRKTIDKIEEDFKRMMNLLMNADVKMRRPVWIMHPREVNHLKIQRNTDGGQLLYPELRTGNPTIHNWPVFNTTTIPSNLGGSGDESEVYLVEMFDAIIGEVSGLEIVANASASYVENATLQSAFSRDETLIRAITMHDFAMRHTVSVAVLTAVDWGA